MDPYKLTFQTYDRIAELYQEKFMDMDLYDKTYDRFCELIPKNDANILELGCGPGNITRYLLKKRPDFQILATDVAPNMIRLAKENNPGAECRLLDCRELDTIPGTFDGIVCGFCIPYLSKEDCAKLMKDCASLLKSNGILYFSYVDDDYSKSGLQTNSKGDQIFFYYHEAAYLQSLLNSHGFELIETISVQYPQPEREPAIHTIVIARRK